MKKYLCIVSGIMLALLCAVSCGKQDGDEEPIVGVGGSYFCSHNETGIDWTISLSSDSFTISGNNSNGFVQAKGRWKLSSREISFFNTVVRVPAKMTLSGQEEFYVLESAVRFGSGFKLSYRVKIGGNGAWSGVKTLTFI